MRAIFLREIATTTHSIIYGNAHNENVHNSHMQKRKEERDANLARADTSNTKKRRE